ARRYHQVATHHGSHARHGMAWCGLYMRSQVGGDPGASYNLARNWAHWGAPSSAGVGAVVVWQHHVGIIVGQQNGQWIMRSGNDGGRVRTRPLSMRGVIAIRRGGGGFSGAYASAQRPNTHADTRQAARTASPRTRGRPAEAPMPPRDTPLVVREVALYDRQDVQSGQRYVPMEPQDAMPCGYRLRRAHGARAAHGEPHRHLRLRRSAYMSQGSPPPGYERLAQRGTHDRDHDRF